MHHTVSNSLLGRIRVHFTYLFLYLAGPGCSILYLILYLAGLGCSILSLYNSLWFPTLCLFPYLQDPGFCTMCLFPYWQEPGFPTPSSYRMMGVSTVSSSLQRGRICLNWLISSSYMVLQWYELQSTNIFLLKSSRSFIYWACMQQKCTAQRKLFFLAITDMGGVVLC